MIPVVGVDVGGPAKGFHAVALAAGAVVAKTKSRDPEFIATWCREQGANVVAIDAPCRWRTDRRARAAERELARERISCFSTPREADAAGRAFFTWMFAGHKLFRAIESTHPVCMDTSRRSGVAIETFPQAVACALAGEIVSAKKKTVVRRELLERAGVATGSLRNIDELDAALCAVAAEAFATGTFRAYGDAAGGFIIVPAAPLASAASLQVSLPRKIELRRVDATTAPTKTTALGYRNRNGQIVVQPTRIPGNDHHQYIYVLKCSHCDNRYGANGSDTFQRKCPRCQGGRPGLGFRLPLVPLKATCDDADKNAPGATQG